MLVPPAAAIPHGKVHPLEWNIGSVHKYTGCFGTHQSMRESRVIMKVARWDCTTPLGDDVVPEV